MVLRRGTDFDTQFSRKGRACHENGAGSRVALYDDVGGTGNSAGPHTLLEVVNTVVVNGDTDILNPVPFTTAHDIPGSTSFLLATADQLAGQFPGPMDQDNPVPEAWVAGNTAGPGSMDLTNLDDNSLAPLQMQAIGFPAAWLLRAKGSDGACPRPGAILFERSTDTISIPGNTILGTAFTAEARIMFCEDFPPDYGTVFIEQYDGEEDKALIALRDGIGGTAWHPAEGTHFVVTPLSIPIGVWQHIAFVHDGGNQRVYLDGILVGSRTVTAEITNHPDSLMAIGAFTEPIGGTFRGSFTGLLDTLRISSVARYSGASFTPPQGDLAPDSATLLLYNFDEPAGSPVVYDQSGNGFHGTLGGGFPGATPPRLAAAPVPGQAGPGTPLCFGDGSGTACPCGNDAPGQTGCLNGFGVGARLSASGTASLSGDTVVLTSDGVPFQPGLFFQGNNLIGGGAGVVFGDGLRCCAQNVLRIQVVNPGAGAGTTTVSTSVTISQHPQQNLSPGDIVCYQHWYRNPGNSPCGFNFNTSNALMITWEP